jgi:hypothetical protein
MKSTVRSRIAKLLLITTIVGIGSTAGHASAAAKKPRWVYVGRELFTINDGSATVPTYVNTGSIEGDRSDSFTITFQARYAGRRGIDHVNIGIIVDCNDVNAYAEQFYVYYSKNKSDYDRTDGGEISDRVRSRALSYCF